MLKTLRMGAPENFTGRTGVDISNPLDFSRGMPASPIPQFTDTCSRGEEVQQRLPGANVAETLNMVNYDIMIHPAKAGGAAQWTLGAQDRPLTLHGQRTGPLVSHRTGE
jgi:hypothetical protein